MAASQSLTVHSKTHRICPIHARNIGPIGPISSTIPSPWIESLRKGRSDMPLMIQIATVPGKWLRPYHVRYIPRPTGSVLFTQEILDPSVQYPLLCHHLESNPYRKAGPICIAWFKELLCQENSCVQITSPTMSVLSTQEILDPSVHYAVLDHLEWSPFPMGRSDMPWMIQSYCTITWGQGEEWEVEGWRRWRMKGKGRGRGWKRKIIYPPPTLNPPPPLPLRGGGW